MTPRANKKASKFLSYVLRHHPEKIGISLDANGYISVSGLITALRKDGWKDFDEKRLNDIVVTNDKKRFSYSDCKKLIRASQGHSVSIDLGLKPMDPPEYLFHGTVQKFLGDIQKEGLTKRSRQHVHLSADLETANKVGLRRGKPVILKIKAKEMKEQGHSFYISANGVWLTDKVPQKFVIFP